MKRKRSIRETIRKSKNDTSLPVGVLFDEKKNMYSGVWVGEEGKRKSKSFSINKYGNEMARQLAIEARLKGIDFFIKTKKKRVEENIQTCSDCGQELDLQHFNGSTQNHARSYCRTCGKKRRKRNLKNVVNELLNQAKSNAKKRTKKGRTLAGEFNLTYKEILSKFINDQKGKCAIAKHITPTFHGPDWKLSLDRLDNHNGYFNPNFRLICSEFQLSPQFSNDDKSLDFHWTEEKFAKAKKLMFEKITQDEIDEVEKMVEEAKTWKERKKSKFRKVIPDRKAIDDNPNLIEFIECTTCQEMLSPEKFRKNRNKRTWNQLRAICKLCEKKLGPVIQNLLGQLPSRGKEVNVDFDYLVNLIKIQAFRCRYSGIRMSLTNKDWKLSLERLDPSKGYIKGNVAWICYEFNRSTQWSEEKVKYAWELEHLPYTFIMSEKK